MHAVLFVEGSRGVKNRLGDPFEAIWQEHLAEFVKPAVIDRVVPISKKDIVALDEQTRDQLSGTGAVPLDERIKVELEKQSFDVAVIVWDLQPPWDRNARPCRVEETIRLYKSLSESDALPDVWRTNAGDRHAKLTELGEGKVWNALKPLRHSVFAVCMEPTFESLLLCCEQTVQRALGCQGKPQRHWPKWDSESIEPEELLQSAIQAARCVRPTPQIFRKIRGDMKNAKNEWGEYLLREMCADKQCKTTMQSHPLVKRLKSMR